MNNGLQYVLDCLRRSADNSSCWPVYPAEAGVLLAEIDRLRKENEELRGERAAVVAWLREVSERRFARNEREAGIVFRLAHEIERGEYHQKEKP